MKKQFLNLCLAVLTSASMYAQCVYTCSNYAVSQITYTTFPSGSTNVTPSFTNPFISGPSADDGSYGPIPIGFNFDFYCSSYTNIYICSNGFITFDYQPFVWPTQFVHPTQNLPNIADPNGMVAFNMTDLDPGVGGTITYTTVGTSPYRMFIVTFSNVPCFSTPSDVNTGQIVLYETTNMIEIHTTSAKPDINQGTAGSTQGIENTNGTLFACPQGRNQNNSWGGSANNTAYQFGPYTPGPPTSITGNTVLCQGEMAFYQSALMTGASSYVWSFPAGWAGTGTLSAITATAGVSGTVAVAATYTCGTSAPITLSVNVMAAPVVSITSAAPNILCSGGNITFNTAGATTYTLNPGGINGVPPFTDIASVSTVYTLTGTDAFGCVSQNVSTALITVKETPTVSVNSGTVCDGQTFTLTPSGATNYVYSSLFPTVTPSVGIYSYSVTGTGTNLCVSEPAVSILTVFALPTVTTAASRTVMCLKELVSLSAGGASTYTWSNNANTSSISVGPITTIQYYVNGTDIHGCVNSSSITITVKACTGINEGNGISSELKVFPNPNNGQFQIELNTFSTGTSLEIFNSVGQLIFQQQLTSEKCDVDLSAYSNGFYYVKVKNAETQELVKIIKE